MEYPGSSSSSSSDTGGSAVLEEEATKLTRQERLALSVLFALILIAAVVGNVASMRLAIKRKHRLFYRCCVVSLAFSDLLLAVSTCTYSLSMFSHPWVNWKLGEFMCQLIPYAQTMAVLANSFTLSAIALDRYHGIINATRCRWEPNLRTTLIIIGVIWMVANGSSIPMLFEYHIKQMDVVKLDISHNEVISWTRADFCAFRSHKTMTIYISLIFTLIFLPLMLTFLTLYGIIGCYLWRRYPNGRRSAFQRYREILALKRRRAVLRPRDISSQIQTDSTFVGPTVSSSSVPPPLPPRRVIPTIPPVTRRHFRLLTRRRFACSYSLRKPARPPLETILEHENLSEVIPTDPSLPQSSCNQNPPPLPSRGIRVMERQKKRILKIIFALMVTFILTRMPIWSLNVIHASTTEVENYWWMMQYLFSALSLLGTVLNPYLYGFMQERQASGGTCFLCRLINRTRVGIHRQGDVEMHPRGGAAGEGGH